MQETSDARPGSKTEVPSFNLPYVCSFLSQGSDSRQELPITPIQPWESDNTTAFSTPGAHFVTLPLARGGVWRPDQSWRRRECGLSGGEPARFGSSSRLEQVPSCNLLDLVSDAESTLLRATFQHHIAARFSKTRRNGVLIARNGGRAEYYVARV